MFEIEDGGEQYCITALGNGMDSKRGSTRWRRLEFSIKPKISLDVRRSYTCFAMMCRTNWTFITERRQAYIDGFDLDSIRSVVSFAMHFSVDRRQIFARANVIKIIGAPEFVPSFLSCSSSTPRRSNGIVTLHSTYWPL